MKIGEFGDGDEDGEELVGGDAGLAAAERRVRKAEGLAAGIAVSAAVESSAPIGSPLSAEQLQGRRRRRRRHGRVFAEGVECEGGREEERERFRF